MKLETLSIISYLIPLAVSLIGSITIIGNRHSGISRNVFAIILMLLTYKFGYDLLAAMHIDAILILAFIVGSIFWYSIAPALYRYFNSLQSNDFTFNELLLKHLIPGILISLGLYSFTFAIDQDTYIQVLNHRFEQERSFERSALQIILFTMGSPLLTVQWVIYYYYLNITIKRHKKRFGKFYGSYEKRNEQLMKQIFFSMASIFFISFCAQFFQLKDPLFIIGINLIQSIATIIVFYSAKEQINIKNYRMYKLSSHIEEIRNNRQVNKL